MGLDLDLDLDPRLELDLLAPVGLELDLDLDLDLAARPTSTCGANPAAVAGSASFRAFFRAVRRPLPRLEEP